MARQPIKSGTSPAATVAAQSMPAWSWIVSGDIGNHKLGETITTKKVLGDYWRTCLVEGETDEALVARFTALTDDQVLAVITSAELQEAIKGMEPDDRDVTATQFFQRLHPAPLGEDDVPTMQQLVYKVGASTAVKYGALVDDQAEAFIDKAIEGKKDYDGSPIALAFRELDRLFGDVKDDSGQAVMLTFPDIGTRKQDSKNDKMPVEYSGTLADWRKSNVPADYYMTISETQGETKGRWLGEFVGATKKGRPLALRINALKAAVDTNREIPAGLGDKGREEIINLRADHNKAVSLLDSAEKDWRNMVNRWGKAFQVWQACRRIEDGMKNVKVRLAGIDTDDDGNETGFEDAFRRNKCIELVNTASHKASSPITMTKLLALRVKPAKAAGGSIAALLATSKRGTKKGANKPGAGGMTSKIPNVHVFGEYLAELWAYAKDKDTYGLILAQCMDAKGGAMCASVIAVIDTLKELDKPGIRAKAESYMTTQAAAQTAELVKARDAEKANTVKGKEVAAQATA